MASLSGISVGDRVPTKTKSCVVRLPRLCAYLFRCRSAFHSFVLYVHTGVRGRNCVDVFLSSREISLCASPAQDVGSRFLKSGGITTALRGGASTVACRSMPTRAPQIVNECKRLFSTVVLLGSYSRY